MGHSKQFLKISKLNINPDFTRPLFSLKPRKCFLLIQINQQLMLEHDNFEFMKINLKKLINEEPE